MKKIFALCVLTFIAVGCEEDPKPVDPIHEFIAFKGPSTVNVDEVLNEQKPFPLIIQLYAFKPYTQDISVDLEVTGHHAEEGVDFSLSPGHTIEVKAGRLSSDTLWIHTVNNDIGSIEERSFDIKITSVSMAGINVGLGLSDPKNSVITVNILDDECSGSPLCIFNGGMINTIGGETVMPVSVVLDKNNGTITFTGDLIDYEHFSNASLTLTLTPASEGATTGTATFGEQEVGTDADGYQYKFVEIGEGSYDAVAGTISVEYEIFYIDGGDWVSWYTVTNVFSVE